MKTLHKFGLSHPRPRINNWDSYYNNLSKYGEGYETEEKPLNLENKEEVSQNLEEVRQTIKSKLEKVQPLVITT